MGREEKRVMGDEYDTNICLYENTKIKPIIVYI